jgi:hypothetical protein
MRRCTTLGHMSRSAPKTFAVIALAATAAVLWSGCGGSSTDDRDVKLRALADATAKKEVAFLYHHNIQNFIRAQSRDVEVIRTRTLQAGEQARAQIEAGMPFAEAAARFSVDARGKANGGSVTGVVRSQEDPPLARAVFSAKLHVLAGPVRLEPGHYYLFRIRKVNPPKHVTLGDYEASQLEGYRRRYYAQLKSQE